MKQPQLEEAAHVLREFIVASTRTQPISRLSRTAAGTLAALDILGPQRITTLAADEAVTQPAMTGLVQRLEAADLVLRQPDPVDGRASLIAITADGRTALNKRRDQYNLALVERLQNLDPHQLAAITAALPALNALTEKS